MSRFSISKISLKQLIAGAVVLVTVAGTIFWFSGSRHARISPDEHRRETRRIEKVMKEAYPNLPRPWLNKRR
jgi:hypothetical protein